jgi:hypothetical protein
VTVEEAQQSQDVVLSMFLTNSHPTNILFDSGASHSFISSKFVAKHNLPITIIVCSELGNFMPELLFEDFQEQVFEGSKLFFSR